MPQDFEKKVQEKLNDFYMEPSLLVWKDITISLGAPKKRRRVIALFFSSAAILCIGGTIFLLHTHSSKRKIIIAQQNQIKPGLFDENRTASPLHATKLSSNKKTGTYLLPENKLTNNNTTERSQSGFSKQKNVDVLVNNYSLKNLSPVQNLFQNNDLKIIENFTNSEQQKTSRLSKAIITDQQQLQLPEANQLSKNNGFISSSKSRSTWSFLFDGGTTNTVYANAFFQKNATNIYHNPGGSNDTIKSMHKPYTGFHVTAGIQYSLTLNKFWTLYSGLQYSFLLNHQRTGQRVTQESDIATSADTTLAGGHYTKITYHYGDGTSAVNTNYASWLEMPVGIGYKINPLSKKTKFEFRAGASFAHMFADKWLVTDGRYDKFYYSARMTNDMILNWHGDLVITLPKNKVIGLQVQHSFTSFAKRSVEPSLYWSNLSVYTTIPLKK